MREDLANGAVWSIAQKWGARVSSLVTVLILARALEPADFGLVAVAVAFISLLAIFIDFGVGMYVVQAEEATDEVLDSTFWVSLIVGGVLTVIMILLAPVAAAVLGTPELTLVLRVLSLNLVINALAGVQLSLLRRNLQFKNLAARFLISNFVASVVAVTLAVSGAGVWALVAQQLTASVVSLALLWRTSPWRPGRRVRRATVLEVYRYGSKITGTNVVRQLEGQGLTLLIGGFLGVTAVGYYSIAGKLSGIFLDLFVHTLGAASIPVFAKYKRQPDALRRGYLKAVDLTSVLGGSALAFLAATTVLILPLAFGAQWSPATTVSIVVSVGAIVHCFTYYDRPLLLSLNREGLVLKISTFDTVVALAVCAAMLPLGLVAVVSARALLICVTAGVYFWSITRRAGVPSGELGRIYARNLLVAALVGGTAATVIQVGLASDQPAGVSLIAAAVMALIAGFAACYFTKSVLIQEAARATRAVNRRRPRIRAST